METAEQTKARIHQEKLQIHRKIFEPILIEVGQKYPDKAPETYGMVAISAGEKLWQRIFQYFCWKCKWKFAAHEGRGITCPKCQTVLED